MWSNAERRRRNALIEKEFPGYAWYACRADKYAIPQRFFSSKKK